VWRAKRPRIERAGPLASPQIEQARRAGVVFVQSPGGGEIPLRSLSDAQLPIALATDGAPSVLAVLAWATAAANPERVSREQAVTAFTAGGAFAEFTDRDKGRLAPGALADLAVFAEDLLTIPVERLGETRAALTMIGGRVVHDVSRP
jgi:predicted amidohydrolase YtcJ